MFSPSRLVIDAGAGEEVLSGSGTLTIADGTAYLTAGAEIAVGSLPAYYGTDGIYADETGCIYLWFPDGTRVFTADGISFRAVVSGGATNRFFKVEGRSP